MKLARVTLTALALGVALLASTADAAETAETADVSLAKEIDQYLTVASPEGQSSNALQWIWKDGPRCSSADGAFEVLLGGRLQWDTQWVTSDDYPADTEDASFFRRVRLEVAGHCYTNCIFKVQVDFAGGTVALKDVYVGLRNIGATKWGTFKAGHFHEQFSLEELTSSKYITFLERSAPTNAFAPSRNDGLGLQTVWQKHYMVAIGVFRDANDQGVATGDSNYAFTMRAVGVFLEDDETKRFVHVGFAFSFRNPNGTVRYRARPDLGTGTRFVDTGSFAAGQVLLFGAELAARYKSFFIAGEFYWNDVSDAPGGGVEPTFYGYYFEVGYFLTGEARGYKGFTWGRTKPNSNFFDGGGGWGAWEVAFRYDYVDLSDSGLQGGRQACYTFGVNWYWNPNARVMFNIIWADIQEGSVVEGIPNGELTAFSMRFAFDF